MKIFRKLGLYFFAFINMLELISCVSFARGVSLKATDGGRIALGNRVAGYDTYPTVICDDVWSGCKATILRGSNIGEGAVVAAHFLVLGDIPSFALVAGTPAQVKK